MELSVLMTNTMAIAISTPTSSLLHSSSSHTGGKASLLVLSNALISDPKNAIFHNAKGIPQLGFAHLDWTSATGHSIPQYSLKMERKGQCKAKVVYASQFGVGAPEALVIGVVALLVFGPKGLAEAARNLGKNLRAFQPTIRELQEVSREFKSSLERDIGLDDIDNPVPRSFSSDTLRAMPQDTPLDTGKRAKPDESIEDNKNFVSASGEYSADEYLKVTEAQLKGTLARLQKEQEEEKQRSISQSESQTPSQVMSSSENPNTNALQEEAALVAPASLAPRPETDV